jgi:hypothetical protein
MPSLSTKELSEIAQLAEDLKQRCYRLIKKEQGENGTPAPRKGKRKTREEIRDMVKKQGIKRMSKN